MSSMEEGKTEQRVNGEENDRHRSFKGIVSKFVTILNILVILVPLLYLLGFFSSESIFLLPYQLCALGLTISFIVVFLLFPAGKKSPRDRLPWYDLVLILMGTIPSLYAFFTYPAKMLTGTIAGIHEYVLAIALLIAVIEAGRRTIGLAMVVLSICFIFYPLLSDLFPGPFMTRRFPFITVLERNYFSEVGIFGSLLRIIFETLWPFLLFAALIQVTGVSRFFVDIALSAVGRYRGGGGKAVVIGSAFMGTLTGASAADVAAVGSVTIPMMKVQGYPAHFAGGIAACAACGAQIMPPVLGLAGFVMADILEIPYWKVCIAAIIPALLYYLTLFMVVDFEAIKRGFKGVPSQELPSFRKVLRENGYFLLPILTLIFCLVVMVYSPERSCFYAILCLIIVSSFRRNTRLNWKRLLEAVREAGMLITEFAIVMAVVSPLVTTIDMTSLGINLSAFFIEKSQGNLFLLLLSTGVMCYFLGLALPTVTSYILLALLGAPAIVKAGVPPLAAHLFIVYITLTDSITPPLAPAAYVAAGLAGASMMKTAFMAMYLGIAICIIPFYIVYNPQLIFIGSSGIFPIVTSCVKAGIGAVFLAASISGYLLSRCGKVERLLLFASSLLLISVSWQLDILGLVCGGLVVIRQFFGGASLLGRRKSL
jgi:TRAP transporter 4TM/12TM fusion protein